MKSAVYLLCLLALLGLAFVQCGGPTREFREAQLGDPAPSFELKDLEGRRVSLDQYRGKIVMLDFWATWCGPCRMSMPLLEDLQRKNREDFVLLAVNLQEPEDLIRRYVERHKIDSTILMDTEGDVGRAYRSDSIPMQVLIDKAGLVRHVKVGFNPKMADQLQHEIEKLRAD